jgi:hypothetical protein
MSSSFFQKLREDIKAGRGVQAQKDLGFAVKDGRIDKNAAIKFFGEIKPLLAANSKPTPLTDAELAQVKADIAARRQVSIDKIPKAIRQGAVTREEVRQYSTDLRRARGVEDPDPFGGKTPQSIFDNPEYIRRKKEAALNKIKPKTGVESANKTIAALERSKITSEPFKAINRPETKPEPFTPINRPETKPEPFTPINRPETKPEPFTDNPSTDNVTKPDTGGAVRPLGPNATKSEKKIAALENDPDFQKLNKQQQNDIRFGIVQEKFGPKFDRGQFNFLLDRLTGSKLRQNRDAQAQERQNIYSRGLSSMFANF